MEIDITSAMELRRTGKLRNSNRKFLKLLSLDPDNASLHYQCAKGFDILGEGAMAVPYYEKAIELGLADDELENAYVELGTNYRIQGRLMESKELFEKSIQKFPGKDQLKVFLALTLHDLGEHAEAMSYLIYCLTENTTNKDILKHHRAIGYLGCNLDKRVDQLVNLAETPEIKVMENEKSVVQKVTEGLKNVGLGYFDTGESCEYDEYHLYFNDADFETRKCALAVFAVMLGNWQSYCSFAFTPQHERKFTTGYSPDEQNHELNNYIEAFVSHHEQIVKEFPVMCEYIIDFLLRIEANRKLTYEEWFPEVDSHLFKRLREDILIPEKLSSKKRTPIKYFLKEAGIPPFFTNDFFE